ncbi:Tol-Pal system beta propeller repeat protein TolB [Pseudomonadales bacterium]|nr:Tol-Pal system beta propeller repeat protein TolB [Pseudomonadales bacterium]
MKLLSVVGWVMGLMLALPAGAELQIEVTQGADDAVNIAVVPFGWLGRGELPEELHQVIASDLQLSGRFQALPVNQMLSLPSVSSDVYVRDWELLNTEYLVLGQIEESGADLSLRFELYDVFKDAVVFQQTIIGRDLDLRDMGHHVSDAVYEALTGVPGAFSTEILYITVVESENGRVFRLNVADADGHRVRTVLQSREPILSGSWAPDGDQIAYVSFERDARPAIYIHNIRTRKRQQVTNFKGLNSAPAFSPDGTKLAMVLSKDGNPEIYVLDLASQPRKLRRLTRHYGIDTEPSWSADGESIIFTSNRGGQPQIYSMRLEDLEVERLTFEGDYNARAVLANRGDGLIMVHRLRGVFHIAYLDLNRGFLRVLTETSLDESPTIAPNDSLLIYATQVAGRGILAGVSIDGGVRFNLPATEGDVREPAWSPRKKKIFNPIVETDLKSADKME